MYAAKSTENKLLWQMNRTV